MTLAHYTPDCTGRWNQELRSGQRCWRCEHCHAVACHGQDIAVAARLENLLDSKLRVLAMEGAQLLEEEREA